MIQREDTRLIDRWFPVSAVDEACGTPAGSGRVEKAIFSWFASRPIAQARAAATTALLPFNESSKQLIEKAVRLDDQAAIAEIVGLVHETYHGKAPVVLDMFSGRGMIPLEAARAGAIALGTDLSPVATLAGRLLADFPSRNWDNEPPLPPEIRGGDRRLGLTDDGRRRLVRDVESFLSEVGLRVAERVAQFYPRNARGAFPWGYIWATSLPCDHCKRRFPLLGSLALRHPYTKTADPGQSLRLIIKGDEWSLEIAEGPPTQQPTYSSGLRADGTKKKGKAGRCPFCQHPHTLETIKAKGEGRQYEDVLIAVVDTDDRGRPLFRKPFQHEIDAIASVSLDCDYGWPFSAVPEETIASGNVHTVMASGYGYKRFGDLMCRRQSRSFIETCQAIREARNDILRAGVSELYGGVLASYAASNLCRRLRYSTRGAWLRLHGSPDGSKRSYNQTADIYSNEASINFQFDFFETGPGAGAGTWASVSASTVRSLEKVTKSIQHSPCRMERASATALPYRDSSVDVVVTDPPYYDMIEYADASDIFFVWLKRILFDIQPDLFSPSAQEPDGLQDKNNEIIVRRVHEPNRVKHDTSFYETMLAKSFSEARRVLKTNGHLVVMFGHSDPDAWRRLLGALQTAGFVVTSAWPSRTESANTGVASIKVTVTIGCRVAAANRPVGMGSEVDREVIASVVERVRQWEDDGLALEDQLMASYGPAMEVYGRYSRVLNPDGSIADLDHYLALARRAVRDAMRLRVDELPLETFDAITRFAIFWLRAKKRGEVPKGEARFFAQADELRLDDLRGRILTETKAGFQLRLHDERAVTPQSSTFEVVRSMAHAWDQGGMEAVAETIAQVGLQSNNPHLWAVVADLASHLPASDNTAKALAGMQRSASTIDTLVAGLRTGAQQRELFEAAEA